MMRRTCSTRTRRLPEYFFSSLARSARCSRPFPPAPEFRPPTMVADPASAVRALDRVPWDDPITPANLTTMREVPSELQGDLLEAMRDILRSLNDLESTRLWERDRDFKMHGKAPLGSACEHLNAMDCRYLGFMLCSLFTCATWRVICCSRRHSQCSLFTCATLRVISCSRRH